MAVPKRPIPRRAEPFVHEPAPEAIDLRGLSPPQPMLHILDVIDREPGPLAFLLSREPYPLYALLAQAGWRYSTRRTDDGVLVTLTREPAR